MRELKFSKGALTCNDRESLSQVSSIRVHDTTTHYTTNNTWYVNTTNGNLNNNNSYNRYTTVCLVDYENFNWDAFLDTEKRCYSNKHHNLNATKFHYHGKRILKLYNSLENNTYKPSPGIKFVIDYPVYREVFAADYLDRNIHHFVAPLLERVSEYIHIKNGDCSHGNRKNHSALTAAKQILSYFLKDLYVATFDISGFFTNIDRNKAILIWELYSKPFIKNSIELLLDTLIHLLLQNCPYKQAVKRSPLSAWKNIPSYKIMENLDYLFGLPIGNFYSQLIANLYLTKVDNILYTNDIKYTRFVDDICVVGTLKLVRLARKLIRETLQSLGLSLNNKKCYIQPCKRGVKFCGKIIKYNRIRTSNRTKKACKNVILNNKISLNKLKNSINSYFGILGNCLDFNELLKLMKLAIKIHGYKLLFILRKQQLICKLLPRYTKQFKSKNFIKEFNNEIRKITRRKNAFSRCRKRYRSRGKQNRKIVT